MFTFVALKQLNLSGVKNDHNRKKIEDCRCFQVANNIVGEYVAQSPLKVENSRSSGNELEYSNSNNNSNSNSNSNEEENEEEAENRDDLSDLISLPSITLTQDELTKWSNSQIASSSNQKSRLQKENMIKENKSMTNCSNNNLENGKILSIN